jgi:hypothetical protein
LDFILPHVLVSATKERGDATLSEAEVRYAHQDVDHWLGSQARHGRAPDVLDPDGRIGEDLGQEDSLFIELTRPVGIVGHQPDLFHAPSMLGSSHRVPIRKSDP